MASLRCHDDFECNKTQIRRNFYRYIKQLWSSFSHIFTHGDVVSTQTVSPQKIQSNHLILNLGQILKLDCLPGGSPI